MARKLGRYQRMALARMSEGNGGTWYAGCGWYLSSGSHTITVMQSLERRGLVEHRTATGMYDRTTSIWTITDAGRAALADNPRASD